MAYCTHRLSVTDKTDNIVIACIALCNNVAVVRKKEKSVCKICDMMYDDHLFEMSFFIVRIGTLCHMFANATTLS